MEPVSLAVVGLGRIARSHIDGIQQCSDQCELGAVVDIQEERARSYADEFNTGYYTSTEEAFADPDIDAVVICVPHHLHSDLAIQACEAGKHVLVEKVMATSVEEGEAMVDAARENGVNLMVAQSRRFFRELQEAHTRRDEIGQPLNLLYNWSLNMSDEAPSWWDDEEKTGGPVYTMLGSHSVDYTLWMLDDREPVSVYADGGSNNPDFEGEDYATIVIGFDDGTHATNYLSLNTSPERHHSLLNGTDGSIYWEQTDNLEGSLVGTSNTLLSINGESVDVDESEMHNFGNQMQEFVMSIQEDRKPTPSGEEILPVLETIYGAKISSETGEVVRL